MRGWIKSLVMLGCSTLVTSALVACEQGTLVDADADTEVLGDDIDDVDAETEGDEPDDEDRDSDRPDDDPEDTDLPDDGDCWEIDDCIVCISPDGEMWEECEDPNDSGPDDARCWEDDNCIVCITPDGEMWEECEEPGPDEEFCWEDDECVSCLYPDGTFWQECEEPNDPGAEEACFDRFEQCLDRGNRPGRCELRLDECLDAIVDDEPDCYTDDQGCWTCISESEGWISVECPPDDECEQQFDECLDNGIPPERCDWRYAECVDHPPPPVDPEPTCETLFDDCLVLGLQPMICERLFDECATGQ